MHKLNALFLLASLLLFTACEDKKSTDKNNIIIENTTEFAHATTKNNVTPNPYKIQKQTSHRKKASPVTFSDTFKLNNYKNTTYTVNVFNQKVTFRESDKAIVLVTFFTTWCTPCIGSIPYMNDLHKKYQKDLLIVGVLIHDDISSEKFKSFLAKYGVKYYIAQGKYNNDFASLVAKTLHLPTNFSIPLTVMYVEGKYFTHYEGSVPVEMIAYDIEEALKTLK